MRTSKISVKVRSKSSICVMKHRIPIAIKHAFCFAWAAHWSVTAAKNNGEDHLTDILRSFAEV